MQAESTYQGNELPWRPTPSTESVGKRNHEQLALTD